ncbi:capsular polysaccharide biosynthesis protein [Rhabdochromatium marinum]|uniref:capsular polysaccharide biosynthesis protein n=1 Tax=Rhabdochromatium marinum TaxID=48729 RepID=UPI001903CBB0|nr:capsular polysaccharide biosynthesis protein [Rhabdochromatium marinum]MBK1649519.1 beta-3-deoxy-D-manno-oct-2-ulosonic acid transferase [Rhabdochromatium marinum]
MIGVCSRGILRIQALEALLGEAVTRVGGFPSRSHLSAVAGWGLKPSSRKARALARRCGLPYLALEDGFLRSVGLGNQDPPLSLIVDDLGVYYDASRPSQVERLIQQPLSTADMERARALRAAWRAARVSKYNHLRESRTALPSPAVLVVDQTFGDESISRGLASPADFSHMLEAALAEHPQATVLVKMHPDVFAGRKRGHFEPAQLAKWERVLVLSEDVHPVALLERVEAVYTVTSQLGFEALLWGRRVRTFGLPFYAGWGLTEDALPAPERRKPVPIEQVIHGALIAAPRYLDPETGARCEVERLVEWMGLQRRMRERCPAALEAAGFSSWKRPLVQRFLQGSQLHFARQPSADDTPLAVWGMAAAPAGREVLRLEDGFLRSVGLGADLVTPLSWVVDKRGLYYDPSGPSELENILQTQVFDAALLERARRLRERIVASGLTKYNVGTAAWRRPSTARPVILVPGQVETDASIRRGAPGIRRNLDLLHAAREANPDAYLLYKPHPDVVAGLRAAGEHEFQARAWCDALIMDVPMAQLLDGVDAVWVLTSLAGFEALLRGKRVVCHGQPFYAGWGLTEDKLPLARRTRRLSLDELVAGTLLLYPSYVSRVTGRYTTAERALDELLAWRARGGNPPWWHRLMVRPLLGRLANARDRAAF